MKMNAFDERTYEKFRWYVKNNIPDAWNVPSIAYALRKTGQFNRSRLRGALKWGFGPTIRVTPLIGAYGEYTPGVNSNEIRIDRKAVLDFEAGKGIRNARAGKVYLVGVTLIHELVHWCDDKDGVDRAGEEGEEFEKLVYGNVIY